MGGCDAIINKLKNLQVPAVRGPLGILLGILNILPIPGLGCIIAGVMNNDTSDIIIGILQLIFCFLIVGWIWAIVWGVLMILRS